MEEDYNFSIKRKTTTTSQQNGRQPQLFKNMEDYLDFPTNERQPHFYLRNERQTQSWGKMKVEASSA